MRTTISVFQLTFSNPEARQIKHNRSNLTLDLAHILLIEKLCSEIEGDKLPLRGKTYPGQGLTLGRIASEIIFLAKIFHAVFVQLK
jgi:hypothetical protein